MPSSDESSREEQNRTARDYFVDVCLIVCFEMVLNELGLTCSYHLNMIYFVEGGGILGKESWIRGQGSGIVVGGNLFFMMTSYVFVMEKRDG